mgnify:CR=1 FL=1
MKRTTRVLTVLMFIFLYIPMAVLIVASFNTGKDITDFEGFTLNQYAELFRDKDLLGLLGNSVLIALLSTGVCITFGTLAARAAIRDVARALGLPYAVGDTVAKKVPFELNMR